MEVNNPIASVETNNQQLLEAYVQKPEKMKYYQEGLNKMKHSGIFTFAWHWSWWAFFGGWAFLLYRKAYIPALVAFLVMSFAGSIIPVFGYLVGMILLGGSSAYFVLKRFDELENTLSGTIEDKARAMQSLGGFHTWVIWLVVGLIGLTLLVFLMLGILMSSPF